MSIPHMPISRIKNLSSMAPSNDGAAKPRCVSSGFAFTYGKFLHETSTQNTRRRRSIQVSV